MNNEDISEIIQKLSSMINNSNSNSNNNQDMSTNLEETSSNYDNNNYSNDNNFNFDFETIMKIKTIMDSFNSTKNSPEANLLMSLKPYLNNSRKQKLDQYIQFLNISKIIEAFNSGNNEVHSK